MQTIGDARALFPKMPDDVFDLWLAPLIKIDGWPFNSAVDSTEGTKWHFYFDKMPIYEIGYLDWSPKEICYNIDVFDPASRDRIDGLIRTNLNGENIGFSHITDIRIRFESARDYISSHHLLPAPVILMRNYRGLTILDGNHRISAAFSLSLPSTFYFDAWIATPGY